MADTFIQSFTPPDKLDSSALWFVLCGKKLLVKVDGNKPSIPVFKDFVSSGLKSLRELYMGRYKGQHCYAAETEEGVKIPGHLGLQGIWGMFNYLENDLFNLTLRVFHVLSWDRNEQFCVHCGSKTENKVDEHAKKCTVCGHISFLRISPAVIVLVSNGNKILLARSPRFKDAMYSVLAGFVEPGETLEDTVKREIHEEVGIDVKDIRYFGSQPWPFPDSLMIAFTASYAGGDIQIDETEILEADWYDCDHLPPIPGKISIARSMIDWYVEKVKNER